MLESEVHTSIIPILVTARVSTPPLGMFSGYAKVGAGFAAVKETHTNLINGLEISPVLKVWQGTGVCLEGGGAKNGEEGLNSYAVLLALGAQVKIVPTLSLFGEGGYLITGAETDNYIGESSQHAGVMATGGIRLGLPGI